jgi:hypothetical protein
MNDPLVFMEIQQGICNLYNDMPTQIFAEIGQADNLMEQLAARTEFKDNVVVLT